MAITWVALILAALFWGTTVLGITIALVDRDVSGWWIVLVFGALPFFGLYRLALRLAQRSPDARPTTVAASAEATRTTASAGAAPPPPSEARLVEPLTNREQEVLALLDKGLTNGEIARELYVSTGTVKSHVNSIFRKLGARNRTEAVAHARRLNLIP